MPGGRTDDICRLMSLLNERLISGHFDYWDKNRCLVYRDAASLRGGAKLGLMAVTHLLVGAGKMGGALLSGWLEAGLVAPKKLAILDPAPGPKAIYAIERGAKHITRPEDIPKSVKTWMKPLMVA